MLFRSSLAVGVTAPICSASPDSAQSEFAFDPLAGVFRSVPTVDKSAAQPRIEVARRGRFEVTLNITVLSGISGAPGCSVTVGHFTSAGFNYQEGGSRQATSTGGSTWRCRVVIPYYWAFAETANRVTLNINASVGGAGNSRGHFRNNPTIALPVNNAVSRYTYNVTL
jgi:hypothetical protein